MDSKKGKYGEVAVVMVIATYNGEQTIVTTAEGSTAFGARQSTPLY